MDKKDKKDKYSDFLKKRQELKASAPDMMDSEFFNRETNKTVSPEYREAKVEAFRKARRMLKDKPVEEAVGDTLDYRQLRKQMGKIGRKGLKSIPVIGAAASLLGAEDASAALPILGDAESAGETPEQEDMMLAEAKAMKDYNMSDAKKDAIMNLKKKLRGE